MYRSNGEENVNYNKIYVCDKGMGKRENLMNAVRGRTSERFSYGKDKEVC